MLLKIVPCRVNTSILHVLLNNQLDALFSMYLFHFFTCLEQPSVHHLENWTVSILHLVYITLCRWLPGMLVRHTRQSPTQSDIRISDEVLIHFDSPDDEHWVAVNI